MQFGAAIFFTEYSIGPVELAQALEERGFESLWAPEHSHIPVSRKTPYPGGGELPKEYYHVMDPFVTLMAAATATQKLKVATGICLLQQRDVIQTAKLVASIDQVSGGRFLFGIGVGWIGNRFSGIQHLFSLFPIPERHIEGRERVIELDLRGIVLNGLRVIL